MDYKQKYEEALKRARYYKERDNIQFLENIFHELKESEDEKIMKEIFKLLSKGEWDYASYNASKEEMLSWLEKQCKKKGAITAKEAWKDMRLEVYAQASGNRHEANVSGDSTKMFSLNDIDEIFDKIEDTIVEQKPSWSEEDEKFLNYAISLTDDAQIKSFLKSLKPQKHWKPSEEQMEALEDAISCRALPWEQLESLYNDLKKL